MIIKVTNAKSEKDAKKKLEEQYTNYTINFLKREKHDGNSKYIYYFDIELNI